MDSEDSVGASENEKINVVDLKNFDRIKIIGRGASSDVYLIIDKKTGKKFTAKVPRHTKDDDFKFIQGLISEYEILSSLNSPFVIKCAGIDFNGFKDDPCPVIITEYYQYGDLLKMIERKLLDETQKLKIIYGIALGMSYIHSKNIMHRDLKPSNILIDDSLLPKISDFSLAKKIDLELSLTNGVGTMSYMAPELINETDYDQSIDVFSFSVIIHQIITGKMPSVNSMAIIRGETPTFNKNIPQSYRNLMQKCMSLDPKKRPTFAEIVSLLKSDKGFITKKVDKKKFFEFINSLESGEQEQEIKFDKVNIEYQDNEELSVNLDPINLNRYEQLDKLGHGAFGAVFKIKDKKTSNFFAAKINILELEDCRESEKKSLSSEINILSKLDSPLILEFIGYSPIDFNDKPKPTFITEFFENKSLDKILNLQRRGLSPKEWDATKILISVYGIASGMAYLHSLNILHRDLKPENVFFDKHLFPKIGDFGLALELGNNDLFKDESKDGTPLYMSPEIVNSPSIYSKSSDVYAFSILLYEIITLQSPFKGYSVYQIWNAVINGIRPKFEMDIPKCYKNLIEKCWSNEPKKRPSFDEIVDLLENNEEFITDEINCDEYYDYIDYIKDSKSCDSFPQITLDYKELDRIDKKNSILNITKIDLNQYEKNHLIKRDDNFKYYEIRNKKTNELFEAKISVIKITNLSESDKIHLSREVKMLLKLNHPSFIKFIGFSLIDFDQLDMPVIVTEKPPNKSLFQLLAKERSGKKSEKWNDTNKLICIYGIASGMSFLHSFDVIHRNLCPESIFLDEYLHPKIGNFGLLKKIHSEESMTHQTTAGIKGNFSYSSPELLEFNEYTKSSDVYAFSLIVYEIMTLEIPFKKIRNFNQIFKEVAKESKRPEFKNHIGKGYRQLIENCWSQNPQKRLTFENIVEILENESIFITDKVDEKKFHEYVRYLKKSKKHFSSEKSDSQNDDNGKSGKTKSKNKDGSSKSKHKTDNNDDDSKSKHKTKNKDDDSRLSLKTSTKNKDDDLKSKHKTKNKDDDSRLSLKTSINTKDDESKSKHKTKNKDDDSKSKHKTKDSTKDENEITSKDIEKIYEHFRNQKCVGILKASQINYLISKGKSTYSSLITSNYKINITSSSSPSEENYVLLQVFKSKFFIKGEKQIDTENFHEFIKECQIINEISHPNISKILGFFEGDKKQSPSFFSEFYSTQINDIIQSIEDIYLVTLVFEISHAMMIAHSNNLIHRNLNIENIFVDNKNHAKITGFGFPIFVTQSEQAKIINETLFCMPQEILQNNEYNEKVDVFSFGMIMQFILRRGKGPFLSRDDINSGIKARIPKSVNKLSYSIILNCLSHDFNKRPSFKAIVKTIIRNEFKLIDGIEPKIQQVKDHLKLIVGTNQSKKEKS